MHDGYKINSIINDRGAVIVYRAWDKSSHQTVILKTLKDRNPSSEALASLEHDFRITQKVASDFVIKAHRLTMLEDGRMAIALEDIGGASLASFLQTKQYLAIDLFLEIALMLAKGIGDIHGMNIIHKDINPNNIIYNPQTKALKITDFDIATELSRESQEINNKGALEGTLGYISPEQTGRMNRFLDYRSDFYSLGATFYEMLTGMAMFRAADALGYVSAHISKTPVRVDQINKSAPQLVADIIEILVAKAPDNRYQSSLGLIHDLTKAKDSLNSLGKIPPFDLKSQDMSERFEIAQKLFGRDEQKSRLLELFDDAASGMAKLLLVRGQSGIGKSALIHEVLRKITNRNGFFLKGKYDQFCRNVPYYAIVQAFNSSIDQILRFAPDQFLHFSTQLKDTLHPNGAIITNLMPDMHQIIGVPSQLQQLNPKEAQVVALRTICDFIKVFASPEHPLVLFLDDMQWADRASLELLENLLTSCQTPHLLLIMSYRNNDVADHHPLALSLLQIAKNLKIDTMDLGPLSPADTTQMVAETLGCATHTAGEFAQLVYQKTMGNPFYVEEILKGLFQEKLIWCNRATGRWEWDIDGVRRIDASVNIVDFLLKKLVSLAGETKRSLMLSACLGGTFQLSHLALALGKNPVQALQTLDEAIKGGIVIPLDRGYRLLSNLQNWDPQDMVEFDGAFKFQHDRVQQAAYSLMSHEEQRNTHLLIARMLHGASQQWKVDITEIARHYLEAWSLITDRNEKIRLFELNLIVAKKAIDANAYKQADDYIQASLQLLSAIGMSENPQMARRVHRMAAETAFQLNDIKTGCRFIEALVAGSEDQTEKAEILNLKAIHLTSSGDLRGAIATAVSSLDLLGYRFPGKVRNYHVALETIKLMIALGWRDPSLFLHSQKLTDRRRNVALKNLALIGHTAFNLGDANIYGMAFFKGTIITMKYGNSDLAAFFFATTAAVLIGIFKMAGLSRRLSAVAIKLDETTEDLFRKSNTATILACFNYFWHHDHKDLPRHFNQALQLAYQTGDNFFRGAAAACYPYYMHDMELERVHELSLKMVAIAQETYSPHLAECARMVHGMFCNLQGTSISPFSITYSGYNESQARKLALTSGNLMELGGYTALKTEILVYRERWAEAVGHAWSGRWFVLGVIATKYEMNYRFFKLLALTQYIPRLSGFKRLIHYGDALMQRLIIRQWSRNNPGGFQVYEAIAAADFAALAKKRPGLVLQKFEEAIAAGRDHSSKMYALACHRAFLFAKKQGLKDLAQLYLDKSIHLYERWGAPGVSKYLSNKYAFAPDTSVAVPTRTPSSHGLIGTRSAANLDMDTIFKVSQAISKEVRIESMTEQLLEMLLENAGASRGLLLLTKADEGAYVQAEIDNTSGTRDLTPRALSAAQLPVDVILWVLRSRKTVIIGDCKSSHELSRDPYLKTSSVSALLAAPIIQQGKVLGVIYLENSQTAYAFTPETSRMVEMLAAQVAIAIENSKLYQNLENKVDERTAEIRLMLANIEQGILSISGQALKVHAEYSRHLHKILESDEIAGRTIEELLLDHAGITMAVKQTLRDSLRIAIGEPVIAFQFNSHHLPKELHYKKNDVVKVLEVDWAPIVNKANRVERILISLRDVTRLRVMQTEMAKKQRQIDLITQILDIPAQRFVAFADQVAQTCNECLDLVDDHSAENLRKVFIALHTLKGLAASMHLILLADEIHKVESYYTQVLNHTLSWDKTRAKTDLGGILQILEEYRRMSLQRLGGNSAELQQKLDAMEKIVGDQLLTPQRNRDPQAFAAMLGAHLFPRLEQILSDQLQGLAGIAESLQKTLPKVTFSNDVYHYPPATQKLLNGIFVHLFSNSMDHGIESPGERADHGKPAVPQISIVCALAGPRLHIDYRDDGRGIHLSSIRQAAVAKRIIAEGDNLTPQQIAHILFHLGFSTKDEISMISGRGVGLDAVKELVHKAEGEISIQLGEEDPWGHRPIELKITLPRVMVIALDKAAKIAA